MSKSLGLSSYKAKFNPAALEALNYLNKIDTSTADNTNKEMANAGYSLAQSLMSRPDYTYTVDGSDAARQRAETATYNSYVEKLAPQFSQQTEDLETRLQNQGLSVGSEAYQRAMSDLQNTQNAALNQAAYSSVLNGQQAFSNSLQDSINSASFSNNARVLPISEIQSLLANSPTGYQVAMNKYNIGSSAYDQMYTQQHAYNTQRDNNLKQTIGATGQFLALLSDKELKENLKKVGKLDNGLTVYLFNYIGDKTPRIGLIAQEVQKVKPDAVVENADGFLSVRYDLAIQK